MLLHGDGDILSNTLLKTELREGQYRFKKISVKLWRWPWIDVFYILKELSCEFFCRNHRCDSSMPALICCKKRKSKVLELCGLEWVLGVLRSLTLPGALISFAFLCTIRWAAAVIRRKILPIPWSIKAVKSAWTDKGWEKIWNPDSHHVSGCCSHGRLSVSYWLIKQRECWDWSFLSQCLMGKKGDTDATNTFMWWNKAIVCALRIRTKLRDSSLINNS